MKELKLDEKMTQELLSALAEMPAKYSMSLIGDIQRLWNEQNPEEPNQEVVD